MDTLSPRRRQILCLQRNKAWAVSPRLAPCRDRDESQFAQLSRRRQVPRPYELKGPAEFSRELVILARVHECELVFTHSPSFARIPATRAPAELGCVREWQPSDRKPGGSVALGNSLGAWSTRVCRSPGWLTRL